MFTRESTNIKNFLPGMKNEITKNEKSWWESTVD